MLHRSVLSSFSACLLGGLLACAALSPAASAQFDPTAPGTLRVTQVKVKPGYGNVWREMQRDILIPYFKRAKYPFVSTYRLRFSEASYGVVSSIGASDMTAETTEEGSSKYRAARRESVEWARTSVRRRHTDLSFGKPLDAPAELLSVSTITIAPGKRNDFIKNFKENGIPRWKKMGFRFLTTTEIIYGHNTGKFVVVTPIKNYAELAEGTPFYRGMSEAERAQLLTGMGSGVITDIQRVVADYIPGLSYSTAQ